MGSPALYILDALDAPGRQHAAPNERRLKAPAHEPGPLAVGGGGGRVLRAAGGLRGGADRWLADVVGSHGDDMGREGRGRMIWGLGVLSEDLGPSLLSPTFFPYYLTRWILSWIGPGALSG